MAIYSHRQPGGWTLWIFGVSALVTLALTAGFAVHDPSVVAFTAPSLAIVLVCAWLFRSLTVEVDEREVRCAFGSGWLRKRIPLAQVVGARAVRNRWWWGLGVRRIPGAWMYAISGLDAVELDLRDGKRFRIGTDEPQALVRGIERALALR